MFIVSENALCTLHTKHCYSVAPPATQARKQYFQSFRNIDVGLWSATEMCNVDVCINTFLKTYNSTVLTTNQFICSIFIFRSAWSFSFNIFPSVSLMCAYISFSVCASCKLQSSWESRLCVLFKYRIKMEPWRYQSKYEALNPVDVLH